MAAQNPTRSTKSRRDSPKVTPVKTPSIAPNSEPRRRTAKRSIICTSTSSKDSGEPNSVPKAKRKSIARKSDPAKKEPSLERIHPADQISTLFEDTGDFDLILEPATNDNDFVPSSTQREVTHQDYDTTCDESATTSKENSVQENAKTENGESDEEPEKWEEDADEIRRVENVRKRWKAYDYEEELFGGSEFEDDEGT